jgi:hypothetical protein
MLSKKSTFVARTALLTVIAGRAMPAKFEGLLG